jgi:hypothetical protein
MEHCGSMTVPWLPTPASSPLLTRWRTTDLARYVAPPVTSLVTFPRGRFQVGDVLANLTVISHDVMEPVSSPHSTGG